MGSRYDSDYSGNLDIRKTESLKRIEDTMKKPVVRDSVDDEVDPTVDYDESFTSGKHSILELIGLGKEVWEGVDADEYIDQERESWDG